MESVSNIGDITFRFQYSFMKFYWNTAIFRIVRGCFHGTAAESSSCDRDHMPALGRSVNRSGERQHAFLLFLLQRILLSSVLLILRLTASFRLKGYFVSDF